MPNNLPIEISVFSENKATAPIKYRKPINATERSCTKTKLAQMIGLIGTINATKSA